MSVTPCHHFSIHDLHETHLKKLDQLSKSYIKKWLKFPSRGASDISIFHPYLLKVKQPSQLYLEGHAGNMLLMRLKRDPVVNACIDSKIERESTWRKKSSTAVKCDQLVAPVVENSVRPATSQASTNVQSTNRAKGALKKTINEEIKIKWNTTVRQLTMQGDFANLLIQEDESVTWQSIARKMPHNVMSFAARLSLNTLASPDNLKR